MAAILNEEVVQNAIGKAIEIEVQNAIDAAVRIAIRDVELNIRKETANIAMRIHNFYEVQTSRENVVITVRNVSQENKT